MCQATPSDRIHRLSSLLEIRGGGFGSGTVLARFVQACYEPGNGEKTHKTVAQLTQYLGLKGIQPQRVILQNQVYLAELTTYSQWSPPRKMSCYAAGMFVAVDYVGS